MISREREREKRSKREEYSEREKKIENKSEGDRKREKNYGILLGILPLYYHVKVNDL